MTNKPIYIKIYDKIKSAIKGGTMVMNTRTTQNYNQMTSLLFLKKTGCGFLKQAITDRFMNPKLLKVKNCLIPFPLKMLILLPRNLS